MLGSECGEGKRTRALDRIGEEVSDVIVCEKLELLLIEE
jgi:hypothetical protein